MSKGRVHEYFESLGCVTFVPQTEEEELETLIASHTRLREAERVRRELLGRVAKASYNEGVAVAFMVASRHEHAYDEERDAHFCKCGWSQMDVGRDKKWCDHILSLTTEMTTWL